MTADLDFFHVMSLFFFFVKVNGLHLTTGLGSQLIVPYTYNPRPVWTESAHGTDPGGMAEFEKGW